MTTIAHLDKVLMKPADTAPRVSEAQIELIKRTIAPDATPDELQLFLYDCQRQGVHPLDKLLHFTKRGGKYTPITSIDFMRMRAADSGEYAGSDVLEHVAIVTVALGRPLPKKAEVHHHNGDPADNRPCNLVLCQDDRYHKLLHRRARIKRLGGHPDHDWVCCRCGVVKPLSEFYWRVYRPSTECKACRRALAHAYMEKNREAINSKRRVGWAAKKETHLDTV